MGANILTRDIGNELPVSVLLGVKDESAFPVLVAGTIAFTTEEQAKLQRHVKSGQAC